MFPPGILFDLILVRWFFQLVGNETGQANNYPSTGKFAPMIITQTLTPENTKSWDLLKL